jgi:HEPN domain-containing protein
MADMKIIVEYWLKLSDEKLETAKGLMKLKRYADALFFCHLVLEAELKSLVALETKENAPLIHHLPKLAELANLSLSEEQFSELKEITTFNIEGRYADYKLSFYKKATKQFAEEYFEKTKILRTWIRKNTPPKK